MEDRVIGLAIRCTSLSQAGVVIDRETDLWAAGMSSMQSVQLMLAVEDEFGIEFPEQALTRATFASVASIAAAVQAQLGVSAGPAK